jgi:hypothetical protein
MSFEVVDGKDRIILTVGDTGQCAFARFEDMEDEEKSMLEEIYIDLTGKPCDKVRKFLDFEDDEGVFCS